MFFDLFYPRQNRSSQVFSVRPAQSIPDDVRTDEIQIKELEIYEEFLTQEPILIDRSKSSSTSVETFEFSKQW